MKLDMDLALQILQAVNDSPDADGLGWVDLEIEGHTREEVSYHVCLLDEGRE